MRTPSLREQCHKWLEDTVYIDNGRRRPLDVDEDGRIIFPASPFDFDRDETPRKFYYLEDFEGWKDEYYEIIIEEVF